MDTHELITTLKSQHRALQSELAMAHKDIARGENLAAEEALLLLIAFKSSLLDHLRLENETFYPTLLKKMHNRSQTTEKTEQFIADMLNIEKIVLAFLDAYTTAEAIARRGRTAFLEELEAITRTLNVRIESEEEGVYEVYTEL